MGTALVTGGSSGIGLAFARELAARGDDLVLVARDASRLASAAQELRHQFGVQVEEVQADLSDLADVRRVASIFDDRQIDTLVNNAGFAAHTDLLSADWFAQEQAFHVMCLAVLALGGAAGRTMAQRGFGEIINVSSMHALLPGDNYSSIKAWVINYSEGLAGRLEEFGVHVTVAIPGYTKSNYHAAAGLDRPTLPGWVWVKPATVAKAALADVSRGKRRSVPSIHFALAAFALTHVPLSVVRAVSHRVHRNHHGELPAATGREGGAQ